MCRTFTSGPSQLRIASRLFGQDGLSKVLASRYVWDSGRTTFVFQASECLVTLFSRFGSLCASVCNSVFTAPLKTAAGVMTGGRPIINHYQPSPLLLLGTIHDRMVLQVRRTCSARAIGCVLIFHAPCRPRLLTKIERADSKKTDDVGRVPHNQNQALGLPHFGRCFYEVSI